MHGLVQNAHNKHDNNCYDKSGHLSGIFECQMQAKPFPPTSHFNPTTTVVGEYCCCHLTNEKYTEKGINFPKVTQLVRTEPVNQPTVPPSWHFATNPWHMPQCTLSPSLGATQGTFRAHVSSHSRTFHIKGGSFEPDLKCSFSPSFCCKERKGIWKRNVSPAYLPCTQTQREW